MVSLQKRPSFFPKSFLSFEIHFKKKHLSKAFRIAVLAGWALCSALRLSAQPAGAQFIPTPNGMVWMVDESWFEKKPPFLEFYTFGEQDGLKLDGSALLLLQDSRGDIWLLDNDAVAVIRYDGHQFKYFLPDPNDPNALQGKLQSMVETPDGFLWVRHDKGVAAYDPQTERFRNYLVQWESAQSVPDDFFNGRARNPGFFDPVTQRFVRAFATKVMDGTNPARSTETTLHWLLERGWLDGQGNIWSFQRTPIGNGLVCVAPGGELATLYPMLGMVVGDKAGSPDYDPWITCMQPDLAGENIWVAGWRGGLRCFNLETKRWTQFAQNYLKETGLVGVDLETTLFITPTPVGKFWLGTTHGLTLFDPATLRFSAWWPTEEPGSIAIGRHNQTNLLTDNQGRLWLSIGHLMVHDDKRHFIQKPVAYLPEGRIRDVFYDAVDNKSWFLNDDGRNSGAWGVFSIDENTGKLRAYPSPISYQEKIADRVGLNGLTKRGNDIFFVTESVLYKLDITSGKYTGINIPPPPELANKNRRFVSLRGICNGAQGSLWISILNTETNIPLVHYFPEEHRFEYIRTAPGGLTLAAPRKVFADSKGNIWQMSDQSNRQGVNCYDPATGKAKSFVNDPGNPNSISNNLVHQMAEDQQGRIWMATDSGICWYDPTDGKIHRAPGLDAAIERLAIDHAGNIWLAGSIAGFYNPSTGQFRIIGPENGLYRANEELYTRKDGVVCYGPRYRISPDQIPVLTEGPVCRFTAFKVFDRDMPLPKAVDVLEKIELPHTDNSFTISWSARSFTNPEQDSFFYQLVGIDEGWVAAGATVLSASYLKVQPGKYRFRLKCKNRDGLFGPEKILAVIIIPAYYQTWWFKLLIISSLAGILAVIFSLRQRQKRLSAELKQQEAEFRQREAEFNQRLSEYQMSALRAQMNPHFIFNSLNSINRFVQMSSPDAASNYLTKFARLIRLVLDNSRSDIITLDSELEAVKLYLELESLRFVGQFDYHLDVDEHVDAEAISVPPLFIQPYLENAIWHGLMQKEGPDKKLIIDIRMENPSLISIQIMDNGIGREQAKTLKSKSATSQKSHGMGITAERMRMFTERTQKRIDVQIMDQVDSSGNPSGTVVKILLET